MLGPWAAANAPRPVAIVLYPFTFATAPTIAAALLLHYVAYHVQLGFAKVIQYTQARHRCSLAGRRHQGGRIVFSLSTVGAICPRLMASHVACGMWCVAHPPAAPCQAVHRQPHG